MKLLLVVAAALIDADHRVLIAQRPEGKQLAGLWEFPGGKLDPGERPERALARELKEELGVEVCEPCLAPLTFASHAYDDFHLLMPLYVCRKWEGLVLPAEGQNIKWVRARDLRQYEIVWRPKLLGRNRCIYTADQHRNVRGAELCIEHVDCQVFCGIIRKVFLLEKTASPFQIPSDG